MKKMTTAIVHIFKYALATFAAMGLGVHPQVEASVPSKEAGDYALEFFKANKGNKKALTWNEFIAPILNNIDDEDDFKPFITDFLKFNGKNKAPKMTVTKSKTPQGDEIIRIITDVEEKVGNRIEKKNFVIDVYGNEKVFVSVNNQPIFSDETTSLKGFLQAIEDIYTGKRKMRMPAAEDDKITIKVPTKEQWEKMDYYSQINYIRFMRSIYMEMYKLQASREEESAKKGNDGRSPSSTKGKKGKESAQQNSNIPLEQYNSLTTFGFLWKEIINPAWGAENEKSALDCSEQLTKSPCIVAGHFTCYGTNKHSKQRCGTVENSNASNDVILNNDLKNQTCNRSEGRGLQCDQTLFGKLNGNPLCVPFPEGSDATNSNIRNNATLTCMDAFLKDQSAITFEGITCNVKSGENKRTCKVNEDNWSTAENLFGRITELLAKEMKYCYNLENLEGKLDIKYQKLLSIDLSKVDNTKPIPDAQDQKDACSNLTRYAISFSNDSSSGAVGAKLETAVGAAVGDTIVRTGGGAAVVGDVEGSASGVGGQSYCEKDGNTPKCALAAFGIALAVLCLAKICKSKSKKRRPKIPPSEGGSDPGPPPATVKSVIKEFTK